MRSRQSGAGLIIARFPLYFTDEAAIVPIRNKRDKTMRYLLLGAAAMALSGCSFLGLGGDKSYDQYKSSSQYGANHNHQAATNRGKCNTGQCLARWNIEGGIGPSFTVGGNAVSGDNTHQLANTQINEVSMDTAYDMGVRAELGGSYALNPNRKITAMGFIDQANSSGAQNWGTINGQQMTAGLSDYKSKGVELGLRQYFAPRRAPLVKSIRPYVEGRLGATRIDAINIENAQLDGVDAAALNGAFMKSGWHGSAAGLVGVETPIARYATIGLESGIRYTQGPDLDNSNIAPGTALSGSNLAGSRTSIPLMLRGRYRF